LQATKHDRNGQEVDMPLEQHLSQARHLNNSQVHLPQPDHQTNLAHWGVLETAKQGGRCVRNAPGITSLQALLAQLEVASDHVYQLCLPLDSSTAGL